MLDATASQIEFLFQGLHELLVDVVDIEFLCQLSTHRAATGTHFTADSNYKRIVKFHIAPNFCKYRKQSLNKQETLVN